MILLKKLIFLAYSTLPDMIQQSTTQLEGEGFTGGRQTAQVSCSSEQSSLNPEKDLEKFSVVITNNINSVTRID